MHKETGGYEKVKKKNTPTYLEDLKWENIGQELGIIYSILRDKRT